MREVADRKNTYQSMSLRMHPRVFAALGKDLVTNDVVAVIELVKNSYDAFAHNVWIEFGNDDLEGPYLEIRDDGSGMTRELIENEWCVVATPYKEINSVVRKGDKRRRVVGNKGLGRLSVARLGNRLHMLTQSPLSPCWEVAVNWSQVSEADDFSQSAVGFREYRGISPFDESGTRLRVFDLSEHWDEKRKVELEDNLSRLLSPFATADEFNIFVSRFGKSERVSIKSSQFLSEPKYHIEGQVDCGGNVVATCRYTPLRGEGIAKTEKERLAWPQIYELAKDSWRFPHSKEQAHCGPIHFDIRAWDIDTHGTKEISEKYQISRNSVRKAIRAFKGISVYRDDVLVLPKSERGLDWLGLDLRRVSQIGRRLSTSQLVGYVSISAELNPKIEDTSDRERLSLCPEVEEFEEIIKSIVRTLENMRIEERAQFNRETPMADLFASLSAEELVGSAATLAEKGARASAVVPLIRRFDESLSRSRETIKKRFEYYSHLATVGTIAQMLVHEIRNRTTIIGRLLTIIKKESNDSRSQRANEYVDRADTAVVALEGLADTFSPLANRNFRRARRLSVLEERIQGCLDMQVVEIREKQICWSVPDTKTVVAVDPGELDAIILNLITNALYWLGTVPKAERRLEFFLETGGSEERVTVWVHDTGPGIDLKDMGRIFWPGVTRKPNGIGMGLTVASELVASYGGQMRGIHPGAKGGASFAFDLPRVKVQSEN